MTENRPHKVYTRVYVGTPLEVNADILFNTRSYRRVLSRDDKVNEKRGAGDGHIVATVVWEEDPV